MNFIKTEIDGVIIVEPRVFNDARGYFFESYNAAESVFYTALFWTSQLISDPVRRHLANMLRLNYLPKTIASYLFHADFYTVFPCYQIRRFLHINAIICTHLNLNSASVLTTQTLELTGVFLLIKS